MLLDLIINGILSDDSIAHLDSTKKGAMLECLSQEYAELWDSVNSPISGDVGIQNANMVGEYFNSLAFYKVAYGAAERTYRRIVLMIKSGKAENDAHERISYQDLLQQEIQEAKARGKKWTEDAAIDQAFLEMQEEVKRRYA